ncbi:uncharacterized protein BP01DRAFT_338092 [Aspergillus saccharolyticus JOP 1030-1]|uniref:Protein kinase domain-containing protein n=1 Tax=Aspergillus saccharolyticus JOP 1030-1 TaxID=1450539 RepID=A0A318ZGC5_9EURO|nr:hypothetical protein BP01DRAFT_338092 [Aspergillus saccharolyticus JOP 1030-1]PYH46601.1 hypothetical protein BP01DRAFT_338092 [Aspergillus saccharolyticus JOP 1030-1]
MYSIIRLRTSSKNHLSRNMSSLAPGHILRGTHWSYQISQPLRGDRTQTSSIFKAEVIQACNDNSSTTPRWASIKVASPSDPISVQNLAREYQVYCLPAIASAKCFRTFYDLIDNKTIALEWLDTTLAEVEYQPTTYIYSLISEVLRALLQSCVILEALGFVNTDYKPANVLLSRTKTNDPTAKVGDLGLAVFPAGSRFNCQPYAMRAPEIFLGQACTGPSQVWAIAAMLLSWIRPGILGAWDSPSKFIDDAWSMAKIKRLFPHWIIPTPDEVDDCVLKAVVEGAISCSRDVPDLQAILPFEEETEKVEMPQQLRDLLRLMLVVSPFERPSAAFVLSSKEFGSFEKITKEGSIVS